ncbi:MAG: hypothetical protein MAG453_00207 [Calditrichaeota bacterium]|nr:hypothetical protein [Calditrichota bacterium]
MRDCVGVEAVLGERIRGGRPDGGDPERREPAVVAADPAQAGEEMLDPARAGEHKPAEFRGSAGRVLPHLLHAREQSLPYPPVEPFFETDRGRMHDLRPECAQAVDQLAGRAGRASDERQFPRERAGFEPREPVGQLSNRPDHDQRGWVDVLALGGAGQLGERCAHDPLRACRPAFDQRRRGGGIDSGAGE